MIVRIVTPQDFDAIDRVITAAFGRDREALLAHALRAEAPVLELVACEGETPIGYVMFSRAWIETEGRHVPAVQLAPVGVDPAYQKTGAGAAMIREGFERLKAAGETHVFVLGHPNYYPRFGFSPDATEPYEAPWPRPAFMLARLAPGGPEKGKLIVPEAFGV
jgi:putative acetyltransferase